MKKVKQEAKGKRVELKKQKGFLKNTKREFQPLKMTLEELYLEEKERIKKLARRYARMFCTESEDLAQVGALAVAETYAKYNERPDEELLKISHTIINRKMYKYAKNEYKHISRII